MKGFCGAQVFSDRAAGTVQSLTLWESWGDLETAVGDKRYAKVRLSGGTSPSFRSPASRLREATSVFFTKSRESNQEAIVPFQKRSRSKPCSLFHTRIAHTSYRK